MREADECCFLSRKFGMATKSGSVLRQGAVDNSAQSPVQISQRRASTATKRCQFPRHQRNGVKDNPNKRMNPTTNSLPDAIPPSRRSLSSAGMSRILTAIVGVVLAARVLFGQEASQNKQLPEQSEKTTATKASGANVVTAVTVARERAKLLHDIYSTTLDVMHRHYFRHDGPVLPARAMEDVFEDIAGLTGDKANWISVNTKAMSINHKPKTAFEKKAAAELSTGKEEYELVENGVYQRAAVIPLRSGCVGCHTKNFTDAIKIPRFAGLVISVPLKVEKK